MFCRTLLLLRLWHGATRAPVVAVLVRHTKTCFWNKSATVSYYQTNNSAMRCFRAESTARRRGSTQWSPPSTSSCNNILNSMKFLPGRTSMLAMQPSQLFGKMVLCGGLVCQSFLVESWETAFCCLCEVVAWGSPVYGGSTGRVADQLTSGAWMFWYSDHWYKNVVSYNRRLGVRPLTTLLLLALRRPLWKGICRSLV